MLLGQVPNSETAGPQETPTLRVHLSEGSLLIGTPMVPGLALKTEFARIELPFSKMASLEIAHETGVTTANLTNGDKISGTLEVDALRIRTLVGEVRLPIKHVQRFSVRHAFPMDADVRQNLTFYNRLGSDEEIRHSVVGPGLASYAGPTGIAVAGKWDYVDGKHGKAVTLAGDYHSTARVRNLVLSDLGKVINPDRGCIEFWFYYTNEPKGYQYGVYRCFDGPYGLGSGIAIHSTAPIDGTPNRLTFGISLGGQGSSVAYRLAKIPMRRWVHIAAVWDREGIENSKDAIRLYVDGRAVAAKQGAGWGNTAGAKADIAGGNDGKIAGKFRMDDLKIWRVAKTDFSDRFTQLTVEPATQP
jgi:hypothetical protein